MELFTFKQKFKCFSRSGPHIVNSPLVTTMDGEIIRPDSLENHKNIKQAFSKFAVLKRIEILKQFLKFWFWYIFDPTEL